MTKLATWFVLAMTMAGSVGCHSEDEAADMPRPAAKAEPRRVPQVQPPIDVKAPPKDAAKTTSGLSYKRLVEKNNGLQARPDESVMIRYTGWRQGSSETFFTTGSEGETITVNPAYAAPAFREMIPLLHKGEKIVVWVPAGDGMPEPVVYEIELVDVVPKAAPNYSPSR
jgi:FKBP-type peptidyl-prolyl cis-trans isomerase